MGRLRWAVRVGFLLLSAGAMVAAIDARRDEPHDSGSFEGLTGVTGQRQPIAFQLDRTGRPAAFPTTIYTQCPGDPERRGTWSPADGAPVRFSWRGGRLTVREATTFVYGAGRTGVARNTMRARMSDGRLDGQMRSRWSFRRNGREYLACDSGNVPFAVGAGALERLVLIGPIRAPWTLYPERPLRRVPRSLRRWLFVDRVDRTCLRTFRNLQEAVREAAERFQHAPAGRVLARAVYVRYHNAQLTSLRQLGDAPSDELVYDAWIDNFAHRVALERRQLELMRRDDLAAAAALDAEIATLKARGNASGIAFGLRTCTSNGPAGAPLS